MMTDKTEDFDNPITIKWDRNTRIRSRIQERLGDYISWDHDSDDPMEWDPIVPEPDADPDERRSAMAYQTLHRAKTRVVIKNAEEAESLYNELAWYSDGDAGREAGITWMNGSMGRSVRRVRREIADGLDEHGYTVESHGVGGWVDVK